MAKTLEFDPLLQHYCDQMEAQLKVAVVLAAPREAERLERIAVRICQLSREIRFRMVELGRSSIRAVEVERITEQLQKAVLLRPQFVHNSVGDQALDNIQERLRFTSSFLVLKREELESSKFRSGRAAVH